MTHILRAIHCIYRVPKAGPLTEMLGYDADGNPIVRATSEIIQPGRIFEENDAAEAKWLIENEGAIEASATEVELYKNVAGAR